MQASSPGPERPEAAATGLAGPTIDRIVSAPPTTRPNWSDRWAARSATACLSPRRHHRPAARILTIRTRSGCRPLALGRPRPCGPSSVGLSRDLDLRLLDPGGLDQLRPAAGAQQRPPGRQVARLGAAGGWRPQDAFRGVTGE